MRNLHWMGLLVAGVVSVSVAACGDDSSSDGMGGGGTAGETGTGGGNTGGGDTGGTGGTAGSGGGETGGSAGEDGMGGMGGTVGDPDTCEFYCTEWELAACNDVAGIEAYDDTADCLATCAGFATTGMTGDPGGDTLQCRVTHLGLAIVALGPDTHCPHAQENPTAQCVAPM